MTPARVLSAVAGAAGRRPWLTIALSGLLGLAGLALALGLKPSAAADTFVGRSSATYQATQRFYRAFGEEPVDVVVREDLQQLLLSSDLQRLAGLEGCLAGKVPPAAYAQEGGAGGPCAQLARAGTVRATVGPGTFVNEAATQIAAGLEHRNAQARQQAALAERVVRQAALGRGLSAPAAQKLGRQAGRITLTRYAEEVLSLGLQYGLSGVPSASDPSFVTDLVFDPSAKTPGTPKQRFAYLFPSRDTALISVRLRAGLSAAQRTRTLGLIRAAVAMPQWQLQRGGAYLLTGEPAIVDDLTGRLSGALALLLLAVALAMALALGLVFARRPRLAPLAVAALAVSLAFGALALASGQLTIAQVAVLPILVGLAVDYAVQVQSGTARGAIALAVLATLGAFLVQLSSPVPMVRGFALLLAVGVVLAFFAALTLSSALTALFASEQGDEEGGTPRGGPDSAAKWLAGAPGRLRRTPGGWWASAWEQARELLRDNAAVRGVRGLALGLAVRRPGRVLAVGAALAALGWGLDTQTHVQSDIAKLVPQDMASLRNLRTLERASGVGGEIDLMVSARDLTQPRTIEWMSAYQAAVLKRFGYSATRGCGRAELCPAFSLPALFAGVGGKAKLTQREVRAVLGAIPPYFSQEAIAPDHRLATLAFGIRLMPLARQQQVIEGMRAALHPPPGVGVSLVGLPVLAAQADAQVASVARRMLTLLGALLAAGLVLLGAFRGDWRRAAAPLLPVALATGWSALIVFLLGIPLNPMSLTLGTLVVAIATEFSVLLCERLRAERLRGASFEDALRVTYGATGAAVSASAVTAIAGFGVLVLSDIQMLRDFGLVTLVDLLIALLGVLVALPAALLLVEGRVRVMPRRSSPARPLRATR